MKTTSVRVLALVATAAVAVGCVTIGPAASGSPLPSGLPSLAPTASAAVTLAPSATPQQTAASTPTTAPTATATTEPTATATTEPTATATAEPTATATGAPTPAPTLNFSLPAVYGSTALTAGFVPDPFSVGVTAGGEANGSYLGGGCGGYTTSAPSFSVNYTSGSASLLRFYAIGSGDTRLIINSPSGTYTCGDDSFGTLNPTVDFNSPSSGRYDVWVATYTGPGLSISATLYVTELSANHP